MDASESRAATAEFDLIRRSQAGDGAATDMLLRRWWPFARTLSRAYFHGSREPDDFEQDAVLGLYAAVRSFDLARGDSFKLHAFICVERALITAVKTAQRQKHLILTTAARDRPVHLEADADAEGLSLLSVLASRDLPTPALLAVYEDIAEVAVRLRRDLSYVEAVAVLAVANGITYREADRVTGAGRKAIDNALQRARRKLAGPPPARTRTTYPCPGCHSITIQGRGMVGAPPLCHVCRFRAAAQQTALQLAA